MTDAARNSSTGLAVRCHSISKSYGAGPSRSSVLKSVELQASCGELTFICGPSGCGKTTLLSIIAGVLKPDVGAVEIFSTPLDRLSNRARARFRSHNIGFVLQQFNLLPALDLVENVAVPLQIIGRSARTARRLATESLARVGIAEYAKRHPPELSVGQQQRVAVARAIVHSPRLIICDEPTGALDGEAGAKIMQLLHDVARSSESAVLVVTHDHRAMTFADRIYELSDGSIVPRGRPGEWVTVS